MSIPFFGRLAVCAPIVVAFAMGCVTVTGDAGRSGSSANAAGFEAEVLTLVNQHRAAGATCGGTVHPPVPQVTLDASLGASSRAHSEDMATNRYFSHTSLDGREFWDRNANAGYAGESRAENIAAGSSSPQEAVNTWMGSTGHCANLMGDSHTDTGVGYAFDNTSEYGHYWTQTFGRP